MSKNISVPDIGDFKDVEIIEVLVKPGDQIKKNDPIVTLESDKSSVEVPSPYEGKISQLKVKIGDKVSEGSILATLDGGNEKKEEVAEPTKEIIEVEEQPIPKMEKTNGLRNGKETIYAQPISKTICFFCFWNYFFFNFFYFSSRFCNLYFFIISTI